MIKQKGFTLIEIMIVVAIIAILSSIAFPSYTEYVMRGRRAEAKSALQQAALWMEKAQTATGAYPLTAQFPANFAAVESGSYAITLVSADGVTYLLRATPAGPQVGDKCGNFTLDQTNRRLVEGATAPMDAAQCWQR